MSQAAQTVKILKLGLQSEFTFESLPALEVDELLAVSDLMQDKEPPRGD